VRNVYLDYVNRNFAPYFTEPFVEKHLNLRDSADLSSSYKLGKSLTRLSRERLDDRNASEHLSETSVNSMILDGHDKQVLKLMWEVERRQGEYREGRDFFTDHLFLVSTTKDWGGRQSKDRLMQVEYAVEQDIVDGEARFVIFHFGPLKKKAQARP